MLIVLINDVNDSSCAMNNQLAEGNDVAQGTWAFRSNTLRFQITATPICVTLAKLLSSSEAHFFFIG